MSCRAPTDHKSKGHKKEESNVVDPLLRSIYPMLSFNLDSSTLGLHSRPSEVHQYNLNFGGNTFLEVTTCLSKAGKSNLQVKFLFVYFFIKEFVNFYHIVLHFTIFFNVCLLD